jgi:chorismate dehydratase
VRRIRYGSVPYLNARPLLEGLADDVGEIRLEIPSRLAELLVAGDLDVALAPVVTSFEEPTLEIVPAGAVVAHGEVGSVFLFCRKPPQQARRVALDTSSRTSASLVRVLFAHFWDAAPEFVDRPSDPDLSDLDADAALLIGDPALGAVWDGPPPLDLGTVWSDWTGLPFVFATWLARDAEAADVALAPLQRAAALGQQRLELIAQAGASELGLTQDASLAYLQHHLSFRFDGEEEEGLERFRELWKRTPGLGLPE